MLSCISHILGSHHSFSSKKSLTIGALLKQIKPFNFVLVGQPEEVGDTDEPIHPITRFTKHIDEAPFQPFIDYNTGKRYTGGSQLYWKPLSTIVREYLNHPESKFRNGHETGEMKRRHLHVQKAHVHYIGKEADQIEQTEILGMDEETYVEYREIQTVKRRTSDSQSKIYGLASACLMVRTPRT